MLNKYPLWKKLLVLMVVSLGLVYAAPNLYPPDPAIQITPSQSGAEMSQQTLNVIESVLEKEGIAFFGEEINGSTALLRLTETAAQLPAKRVFRPSLEHPHWTFSEGRPTRDLPIRRQVC